MAVQYLGKYDSKVFFYRDKLNKLIYIKELELHWHIEMWVGNSVRSETNGPKFQNHPIST